MANLQYIGARYVPKFYLNPDDNSNDWKQDEFEALTIVTYNNDSYTSKIYVPDTVGNPADNPQFWACTTKYTAALISLQNNVANIDGEIDALDDIVKTCIVTPQMYGAKGDGVTDDTLAFNEMASATGAVFIPKASYVLNSPITINNVISDLGTYPNYLPMYARPLSLHLDMMTAIKKDIPLNSFDEYEESCVYLNGFYYVVTNERTINSNGVLKYDSDFNLIDHVSISKTGIGTVDTICTDGNYLYMDFSGGAHSKFSPSDLSTPILTVMNSGYRFTCYYNKQLYAINVDNTGITVSKIDDTLSTLTDSFFIARDAQTIQSAAIYNGQVYVATTTGLFTIIDLVSHEYLNLPYMDETNEIESFFEKDGELLAISHLICGAGTFRISNFKGGIDAHVMKYEYIDNAVYSFNAQMVEGRPNIYHITNGLTGSRLPIDECDVLWTGKNIFAYSVAANRKYHYNGSKWVFDGCFSPIKFEIDGSRFVIYVREDGTPVVYFTGYRVQHSSAYGYSVEYVHDFSDLYTLLGWADSGERSVLIPAIQYGTVVEDTKDTYVVEFLLQKTRAKLNIRNITKHNPDIDVLIGNIVPLFK